MHAKMNLEEKQGGGVEWRGEGGGEEERYRRLEKELGRWREGRKQEAVGRLTATSPIALKIKRRGLALMNGAMWLLNKSA